MLSQDQTFTGQTYIPEVVKYLKSLDKKKPTEAEKPKMVEEIMSAKVDFEKPRIEEGIYLFRCKQVKEITDGKHGKRIVIACEVIDEKNKTLQGVELGHVIYSKMTPNSKATKAVEAFCVEFEFKDQGSFDFDELVGREARGWVDDYETKELDEKNKPILASTISKFKPKKVEVEVVEEVVKEK